MLVFKLIERQDDRPLAEQLNYHLGYLDEIERHLAAGGQCGTPVAQELVEIARDLIRIYGDCSKRAARGLDAIARDLARIHDKTTRDGRAAGSSARGAAEAAVDCARQLGLCVQEQSDLPRETSGPSPDHSEGR
jgi:hypothetical protein